MTPIIHQIWVGDSDVSPTVSACMQSVMEAHIGTERPWTYKLHLRPDALLDHDYGHEELANDKLWAVWDDIPRRNTLRPWAMRADFLKLLAVLRHGGIVLDADMYCVRPLDPFLGREFLLSQVNDVLPPPGLVGEIAIGAHAGDRRIRGLARAFVGRLDLPNGRYDMNLTGWVLVKGWSQFVENYEVFCPHWRGEFGAEHHTTEKTHTIHCFSEMSYDLDRLASLRRW